MTKAMMTTAAPVIAAPRPKVNALGAPLGSTTPIAAAVGPESESRFSRCKSVRISAALWYRSFRSFSSAFMKISSSFGGTSGLSRTGATGARFKIASAITPELSPRKGMRPVAIS